ncbi:unnamed protein product [Mytilus edulis]|uniref:Uncharacterized protein n=1 Tax=Mytilus edulis TaxID=6550 RepID=A0A8S3SFE4_MYTED|nr:unnamed protein product [Mytilus edulis]
MRDFFGPLSIGHRCMDPISLANKQPCVCCIGGSWQPWCADCLLRRLPPAQQDILVTEHYRSEDNGLKQEETFDAPNQEEAVAAPRQQTDEMKDRHIIILRNGMEYCMVPVCSLRDLRSIAKERFPGRGEAAEVSIPVDKKIIGKIEEYVGEGLVSSSCLRPLLEQFVRHEIFAGEKCANWTNRRFFQSQRDISNFVYAAKLKGLKTKYDQENLMAHVDE